MRDAIPTLEELADEFSFVEEAVRRATERMRRGNSLPDYIYKTVVLLTKAYTCTVRTYYPESMVEGINKMRQDLREFREMYAGYTEKRVAQNIERLKQKRLMENRASQADDMPVLKSVHCEHDRISE
jgi:hypothetical protein